MTLQPLLCQSIETVLRHAGQDLFQTSRAPAPDDGADHTREKQGTFMAYAEKAHVPLNRLVALGNMDIQDGQDKQNEKLLRGKRTRSMIGCSFEVIHDHGNGFWNPC